MSNIFKEKKSKITSAPKIISDYSNSLDFYKHFPPASKEWSNSIYAYNKQSIKLLPSYDKMVINLIKSYLNLYDPLSVNETKKRSKRLRIRMKRLSTNKILVSKAEVKHTNNSIIITLYIYNTQELYLKKILKKINPIFNIINKNLLVRIKQIRDQAIVVMDRVKREKDLLGETINYVNNFNYYETEYYKKYIKKSLYKEMLTIKYRHLLFFNNSKFENTRISWLNRLINKIYGKAVQFNFINLKYVYLNSDILSEAISLKLKNKKNSLLRVLTKAIKPVKLPIIKKSSVLHTPYDGSKTLLIRKVKTLNRDGIFSHGLTKDLLDQAIQSISLREVSTKLQQEEKSEKKSYSNYIENTILNNIKHKSINGIRLQSSGRLTRRLTAARSLFKFKYKGSLKNINSSYKSLSCLVLRGHVKSNIQHTKMSSKNRNGSFGIKGWISST